MSYWNIGTFYYLTFIEPTALVATLFIFGTCGAEIDDPLRMEFYFTIKLTLCVWKPLFALKPTLVLETVLGCTVSKSWNFSVLKVALVATGTFFCTTVFVT